MRELPIHTAMKRRTAFLVAFLATVLPWLVLAAMTGLRALVLGEPFGTTLADVTSDIITRALSQALALGVILWAFMLGEAPESAQKALGIRRVPNRTLLVAALAGLTMHIVLAELANVIETFVPHPLEAKLALARLLAPTDMLGGVGVVLAVLVVAPVGEELVYRGLVLPRLALRTGAREATFLTAVLFGLGHAPGGLHAMLPAMTAGLVLAYVRRAQRSVLPAIALHAGANAVPLLLPPSLARVPGLNVVRDGPSHVSPALVLMAALCLAASLLLLARDRDEPST